jgi:quinol monooxygenase YgiN
VYGSIFRMRVKKGREQKIIELMDQWEREVRPKVPGAVAAYTMRPDAAQNELIGVAIFKDQASYRANAASPAQDAWYRRMREHLTADPKWEDGEFIGAWK